MKKTNKSNKLSSGGDTRVRTEDLIHAIEEKSFLGSHGETETTVLVPGRKYKTPYNYSLIPKIEWSNGRAEIFLLVSKDLNGRRGKKVESRRVTKRLSKKGVA